MSERIQQTVCDICGRVVYATFLTSRLAVMQGLRDLEHHKRREHPNQGGCR